MYTLGDIVTLRRLSMRKLSHVPLLGMLWLAACSESPVTPPDAPTGALRATATTTGPGAKPTQLQLVLGDGQVVQINANGSTDVDDLPVGSLTARVVVPGHCAADHYAPRDVDIEDDGTTELTWSVRCPLPVAPGMVLSEDNSVRYANADGSGVGPLAGWPAQEPMWEAALSPARTRVAYIGQSGALTISDIDRVATLVTELDGVNFIDWAPDGQRLLVGVRATQSNASNALLVLWADGEVERTVRQSGVQNARWAPDGRRIAYREGFYIYVEHLDTGARVNTNHILNGWDGEPSWSPDGTRLAFIDTAQDVIRVMDADGSNLRTVAPYSRAWFDNSPAGLDWGTNDLLLLLKAGPSSDWGMPHVVPSYGGNLVPLMDAGSFHVSARWAL